VSAFDAAPLDDALVPRVGGGFRLQWEEAQGCHVLLYPEGLVKLNRPAGEIMARCDGQRTLAEIVVALEAAFQTTGLRRDVEAFLNMARDKQWVQWSA
jgi:pyrroloquinoline quinone biosynthesis protein D